MYITQYLTQHRNDFTAVLKCEHCGVDQKLTTGYDDANYHDNVIPSFHCQSCGKNRAGEQSKVKEEEQ